MKSKQLIEASQNGAIHLLLIPADTVRDCHNQQYQGRIWNINGQLMLESDQVQDRPWT